MIAEKAVHAATRIFRGVSASLADDLRSEIDMPVAYRSRFRVMLNYD